MRVSRGIRQHHPTDSHLVCVYLCIDACLERSTPRRIDAQTQLLYASAYISIRTLIDRYVHISIDRCLHRHIYARGHRSTNRCYHGSRYPFIHTVLSDTDLSLEIHNIPDDCGTDPSRSRHAHVEMRGELAVYVRHKQSTPRYMTLRDG